MPTIPRKKLERYSGRLQGGIDENLPIRSNRVWESGIVER